MNVRSISEKAVEKLMEYNWPGNVRELENSILRAMLMSGGKILSEKEFPFIIETEAVDEKISLYFSVKAKFYKILRGKKGERIFSDIQREVDEALIKLALKESGNSQSKAAKLLGINRNTLRKKIKEMNLKQF